MTGLSQVLRMLATAKLVNTRNRDHRIFNLDNHASEGRSSMIEERDVKVKMRDGVHLALDVYRPDAAGSYPVVYAAAVHNKDLHRPEAKNAVNDALASSHPGRLTRGSAPHSGSCILRAQIIGQIAAYLRAAAMRRRNIARMCKNNFCTFVRIMESLGER
jgi:hypothetical protein